MKKVRLFRPQVLLLSALCYSIVNQATAFDPTRDKVLYAVGYGHLDDQWNWTIQETINNFIPDSLHQNFAFFTNANYTNYTFSFEGALRYQFIKEYYPADFLTLSNYIQQGRWHVAGSMITPSGVNIHSPEASSATRFTPIIIGPRLLAEAPWTCCCRTHLVLVTRCRQSHHIAG